MGIHHTTTALHTHIDVTHTSTSARRGRAHSTSIHALHVCHAVEAVARSYSFRSHLRVCGHRAFIRLCRQLRIANVGTNRLTMIGRTQVRAVSCFAVACRAPSCSWRPAAHVQDDDGRWRVHGVQRVERAPLQHQRGLGARPARPRRGTLRGVIGRRCIRPACRSAAARRRRPSDVAREPA